MIIKLNCSYSYSYCHLLHEQQKTYYEYYYNHLFAKRVKESKQKFECWILIYKSQCDTI